MEENFKEPNSELNADGGQFGTNAECQYLKEEEKTLGGQVKTGICLWPILKDVVVGVSFGAYNIGGPI